LIAEIRGRLYEKNGDRTKKCCVLSSHALVMSKIGKFRRKE